MSAAALSKFDVANDGQEGRRVDGSIGGMEGNIWPSRMSQPVQETVGMRGSFEIAIDKKVRVILFPMRAWCFAHLLFIDQYE